MELKDIFMIFISKKKIQTLSKISSPPEMKKKIKLMKLNYHEGVKNFSIPDIWPKISSTDYFLNSININISTILHSWIDYHDHPISKCTEFLVQNVQNIWFKMYRIFGSKCTEYLVQNVHYILMIIK